jgi:hypothetical protein
VTKLKAVDSSDDPTFTDGVVNHLYKEAFLETENIKRESLLQYGEEFCKYIYRINKKSQKNVKR